MPIYNFKCKCGKDYDVLTIVGVESLPCRAKDCRFNMFKQLSYPAAVYVKENKDE